MGLTVYLKDKGKATQVEFDLYQGSVTHNLNKMAEAAGIYEIVWRPDENQVEFAHELMPRLEEGLLNLQSNYEYFQQFNPENGWGSYDYLVNFIIDYISACKKYPNAYVEVSG